MGFFKKYYTWRGLGYVINQQIKSKSSKLILNKSENVLQKLRLCDIITINILILKGDIMDEYVQKLNSLMKSQKLDEEYIELCCGYAQKLIDNNVRKISGGGLLQKVKGLKQ